MIEILSHIKDDEIIPAALRLGLLDEQAASRLAIKSGNRGRGAFLQTDTHQKDDIIISLKPEFFISPSIRGVYGSWDAFRESKLQLAFSSSDLEIIPFGPFKTQHDSANFVMAVFLLHLAHHAREQTAHVQFLLSYLPADCTTHPVCWLLNQKAVLIEREEILEADLLAFAHIHFLEHAIQEFKTLNIEGWKESEFLWALAITLSRTWKYGQSSMIAPLFDLFNHDLLAV